MNSLSILIADDHEVVRRGIRTLFEVRPEWKICGEAATGRDAIEKTRRLCPDVILLDITMPDINGFEAIPQILSICPSAKILVLTMHDSGETATKALALGASGLVLKSDAGRDLLRAVQAIEKGQFFLSPAVTKIIVGHLAKVDNPGPLPTDLTPRELEIARLLAQGKSNKEVATALQISVKTVEAHRTSIMRKLNLNTYSQLIHFAIRHKIVEI
jgi:DNA-binding NarL/FixJ family response regulator